MTTFYYSYYNYTGSRFPAQLNNLHHFAILFTTFRSKPAAGVADRKLLDGEMAIKAERSLL